MNVRDGAGKWRAIDNSLRGDGRGGFSPARGAFDLTLPATLADPVRVADGERWLSLAMRGTAAAASIEGAAATYEGAGEGVTAKLSANDSAVKEDLVLASDDAQASFSYDLNLSAGLRPVERADGGIDVVDGREKVVFAAPAPVAADAKGAAAPDAAMALKASKVADGWVLSLSLDRSWLKAPGRAFPVVLDPSFSVGATRDCSLRSSLPTTSQCSSASLYAGRISSTDLNTAVAYFDIGSVVPQAAFIASATVKLTPTLITSPGAVKSLRAREVSADWDNNATWNKRTAAANWTNAGGDTSGVVQDTQPYPTLGVASKFTVTKAVASWVDGTPNLGIAITDSSGVDGGVAYASADSSDSTKRPMLEVTYWPRTGQTGNYTIDSQQLTDRQSIGVNVASGNFMLTAKELQVSSTGIPLDVTRFYNSGEDWDGQAGQGGRFSIGKDVVLQECDSAGSRCLIGPSGYRVRFTKDPASGRYETPAGIGNVSLTKLTTGSMNFELRDNRSGTVMEFFDASYSWLKAIRDKNGNRMAFENTGPLSSMSKITDTHNREYPITSNSAGRVTKIEAPSALVEPGTSTKGQAWQYGYNPYGFLTSATDPEGKVTQYEYSDATNRLEKITDPRGNQTLIVYDSAYRVTSVTRKIDGTTANDITTTYEYPAVDMACSIDGFSVGAEIVGKTIVKTPNTNGTTTDSTTYCWDQNGVVLVAKDAAGRQTSTTYTPEGNVSELAGLTGTFSPYATTAYTYGSGSGTASNPTQIKQPAGEKTDIAYGTVPPSPATADLFKWAQSTESTDEQGDKQLITYDDNNRTNPTKIENQRGPNTTLSAELTWDPTNKSRLASSKDKNGGVTTYGYTAGNLTSVAAANATITGLTQYTYDGISRVTRSKDGRAGQWVDYTYDKLGRQLTTPDSDGLTQSLTYDANGNVTARAVAAAGQSSSYTYDKLNRRTSETLAGATTTYTYDKAGNLKTLTDASGTVTYSYDAIGRVTDIEAPNVAGTTDHTTYGYSDPTGPTDTGAVTETLPGSGTIKQSIDISGKIAQVLVRTPGSVQTFKQTFAYVGDRDGDSTPDRVSNLQSTTVQLGGTSATPQTRAYSYDVGSQIKQVIASAGGTTTDTTAFTYDGAGNRLSRVKTPASGPVATTTYAYNENNQLCWQLNAASSVKCKGQAPGGISSGATTAPYGAPPAGATTYTYDTAGNQNTGGSAASWDAKGRINAFGSGYSTILSPNNNELTGLSGDTFTNNALGVSRITVSGNLTKLTRNPSGAVVSQIRDSTKRWFVTDQIGSTTALVESNGTLSRSYDYDIDGNATTTPHTSGPESWIKYAGGHDVGGGLYHFGARYYQPSSARWTQMDPLLQPSDLGQANRYSYVGNNPVNAVDPSGLLFDWIERQAGRYGWKALKKLNAGVAIYQCGRALKNVFGAYGSSFGGSFGNPSWEDGLQCVNVAVGPK